MGTPFLFFTDAILRAPTIACMLMCFAAALVGVIVFLKKESLLGESLSHAAYPGIILGATFAGMLGLSEDSGMGLTVLVMSGAFLSALLGLWAIAYLERSWKVPPDAALCFILSVFFGIGLTLASRVQFVYSSLYRQVQQYLYGQAATMTDIHILIYGGLAAGVTFVIVLFYKEVQATTFDRDYAKSLGVNARFIDMLVFLLIVSAVVIGIRSVGVVLMSAMLIAPAVAARQFTDKLYLMLMIAGGFGLVSGFLGNYLSVEITQAIESRFPDTHVRLPTGPMIVVVASFICLFSLLFATRRGIVVRLVRIAKFRYRCLCENLLKAIWRIGRERTVSFEEIARHQSNSSFYLACILKMLVYQEWIEQTANQYRLTAKGAHRAARIVRLHRLWELYLVDYLGIGAERVHRNAEEMEHILTPEIEMQLTVLLEDPQYDPHHQPIPVKEG